MEYDVNFASAGDTWDDKVKYWTDIPEMTSVLKESVANNSGMLQNTTYRLGTDDLKHTGNQL